MRQAKKQQSACRACKGAERFPALTNTVQPQMDRGSEKANPFTFSTQQSDGSIMAKLMPRRRSYGGKYKLQRNQQQHQRGKDAKATTDRNAPTYHV